MQSRTSFGDTVGRVAKQLYSIQAQNNAVVNRTLAGLDKVGDFTTVEYTWPNHEVCNVSTAINISVVIILKKEFDYEFSARQDKCASIFDFVLLKWLVLGTYFAGPKTLMKDEEPGPFSQPLVLGHNRLSLLLHLGTRDQLFFEISIGRIRNVGLALARRVPLPLHH